MNSLERASQRRPLQSGSAHGHDGGLLLEVRRRENRAIVHARDAPVGLQQPLCLGLKDFFIGGALSLQDLLVRPTEEVWMRGSEAWSIAVFGSHDCCVQKVTLEACGLMDQIEKF